jgi:hypothetical protein
MYYQGSIAAIANYIALAGSLRMKVLRLEIFDKLSDLVNSLRSNNTKSLSFSNISNQELFILTRCQFHIFCYLHSGMRD